MDDDYKANRMTMAGLALQGLLADPQAPNDMRVLARAAVSAADALLKELAREPEPED